MQKTFAEAQNDINSLFKNLHIKMMTLLNDQDKIRNTFFHEEFSHSIGYPFMDKKQLQTQNLQLKFEAIVQSYRTIQMNTNNKLTAHLIIAHLPAGSGKKRIQTHSFSNQQEYAERIL